MKQFEFTSKELFEFIDRAGKATYAGGGKISLKPERADFHELEYKEGNFYYRDSYTGHTKSRGMELVRYKGKPVWSSLYGGGMVKGKENLADKCFNFLKEAMKKDEKGFKSFRGPHHFKKGDWKYRYEQTGDVEEFSGNEEIYFKKNLVFYHKMIGGIIQVGPNCPFNCYFNYQ